MKLLGNINKPLDAMSKYAIITENDISDWEDETGTRYHFPNKYLKILETGTKVIYYKGKIKDKSFENKRLSNDPHYFGIATIGEVWQDDENSKNYFSEILDYTPFSEALYFKDELGNYFEEIPKSKESNYWRDGVRVINEEIYNKILNKGSHNIGNQINEPHIEYETKSKLNLVKDDILKYFTEKNMKVKTGNSRPNYSSESKKVGDIGEKAVIDYLKQNLAEELLDSLIWHANIGETPGYDISYIDEKNKHICIEVKTTAGKLFNNFIMTTNEINSAKEIRENYKIYLVSDCFSKTPKLNILNNPIGNDKFRFEPISYNVLKFE